MCLLHFDRNILGENEQGEFLLSTALLCGIGNRTGEIKPCLDSSALAIVSPGSVFIPSVLIQGHLLLLNSPVPIDMFLLGMFGWQSPDHVGPYGGSLCCYLCLGSDAGGQALCRGASALEVSPLFPANAKNRVQNC